MPRLLSYNNPDIPRDIAIQIASYVRVQWPFLFGRRAPLWESAPYSADGVHFVMVDDDVLISHAIVNRRAVEQAGERFIVYGLSSVFTYPTHRGHGFGEQVVRAATDHIRAQPDADLAMLFCGERVKSLYERCGWSHAAAAQIYFGDRANPTLKSDNRVMTLLLSAKARAFRDPLLTQPLYVGAVTW